MKHHCYLSGCMRVVTHLLWVRQPARNLSVISQRFACEIHAFGADDLVVRAIRVAFPEQIRPEDSAPEITGVRACL